MRFVHFIILPLLMTSCFSRMPEELPSQEVLRRAILETITLDAVNIEAALTVSGAVAGSSSLASFVLTGTLAPLRHAWIIDVGSSTITGLVMSPLRIKFELVAMPSGDIYLRVDELQSTASGSILRQQAGFSGSILGRPVRIVRGTASQVPLAGPDPRAVEVYASAIEVLSGGLRQVPDGSYVYQYGVRINPAMLGDAQTSGKQATITGELTIDPQSFALRRAHWTLSSLPSALGVFDATVDIRFHNHNAVRLSLPALTGSDVSLESIFDMFSLR